MNDTVLENAPVAVGNQGGQVTPMRLLEIATQQNADIDKLAKLMDLQERWEKNEARKAFVVAMSAFKANPPSILKSKQVNIPGGAKFAHATLAEACDAVCMGLSEHGLSHKWETSQEGNLITVSCVITHVLGHSERVTLTASPDDSGKKNAIQQVASTVTYLQRYTLLAATGLAAKDMDDDGRGSGKKGEMPESARADHEAAIDGAADLDALEKAWGAAATAAQKHNDTEAYDALKAKAAARKKALKK